MRTQEKQGCSWSYIGQTGTSGGREGEFYFFLVCIEELEEEGRRSRREVDSQAEKDAAEHPRQADREEKVPVKKKMTRPMQEAAAPSVIGQCMAVI